MVSYNTRDALRESLLALDGAPDVEVVVVDNASTDGSAEMVAREFPGAALEVSPGNLGFGAAANRAAALSGADLLLFLNPDCSISARAVKTLVAAFERDPNLGFAGPRIELGSGRVDHAALRADPDPVGAALYLTGVTRLFPSSPRVNRYSLRHLDYAEEQELLAGTAACLMVRASAFKAVRGFDEAFFMYGEDLDLCRRLREAGHPGLYVPAAVATHVKGEASRKHSSWMLREFHRAMWTYYRKHEAPHRPALANAVVGAGIAGLAVGRLAVNAFRRDKRVSAR